LNASPAPADGKNGRHHGKTAFKKTDQLNASIAAPASTPKICGTSAISGLYLKLKPGLTPSKCNITHCGIKVKMKMNIFNFRHRKAAK
jgi:hypothetical protein